MKVTILPYDPKWVLQFVTQKVSIETVLSGIPIHSVEHVGSTSIPGIECEYIVDCHFEGFERRHVGE